MNSEKKGKSVSYSEQTGRNARKGDVIKRYDNK
jgi:hypothetical protein